VLAGVVGTLLDGGEIEAGGGTIGSEEFLGKACQKLEEPGILVRIGR
jgi:hypothetical protein